MSALIQDLKYVRRIYLKTPGVTLAALLALALGIGASTAVFSVVNTILIKPLPYPDFERIVIPWRLVPPNLDLGYNELPWGLRDFRLFLEESKTFKALGAFKADSFNLTGAGDPALLEGIRASAGFFHVLSSAPIIGRTFTSAEDQPGHEHEVVLSYHFWQDRFGGNTDVLGRPLDLNGETYIVIGVMPADFSFPRAEEIPGIFNFPKEEDVWVPLALPATAQPNQPADLAVIGRLKPEVTIGQAQEEMNIFAKREESEFPRYKGWFNSRLTPLAQQVVGDTRRPLLLLLGAVGVVLLIVCSNVANLLLARAVARKREFELRAALGAGPRRLIRQLVTEGLLLAAVGGLLGGLVAEVGIRFVKVFGPSNIPRLHEVGIDLRVLAFAVGIALITGIFFGLAPAVGASREDPVQSLKESGQRSGGSAAGSKLRKSLLVAQVALTLVLVIAATLLVQTFFRLLNVDGGFNAAHVLTFKLSLPGARYSDPDRIVTLYRTTLQGLQSLPGVEAAGIVSAVPMDGATESGVIRIIDHPVADDKDRPFSGYTIASPGYFSAVGTPLLRGRDFLETDVADSTPVTIINNAMAKKYWPGENPIGKQVGLGSLRFPAMTIVGIAADVKHLSLRENPSPEMYVPYTQKPYPSMLVMSIVLRTKADPTSLTGSLRHEVHSIDPDLPVAKVSTLESIVDDSMTAPRFSMLLFGSFGGLALVLTTVGMYGVISYSTALRTQEIGLRMAVGAQPRHVFQMVLGEGIRLAGLGIVIGCVLAWGITRTMASFLYGVHANDVFTFVAVCLLVLGVALFACYLPARHATRIDPIIALRHD